MPASVMISGSQLFRNHRLSRFMKNIVHSSSVTPARPSSSSIRTDDEPAAAVAPPRFNATNRGDSGRDASSTAASTSGVRPPIRNMLCQPKRPITAAATQPAHADPNENPQNIVMTTDVLDRAGMNSDVSASALGMAPPIPNPVMTRNTASDATVVAVAVTSEPRPNVRAQATSTGFRPMRSAIGPNVSAPNIIPKVPLEMTAPSMTRGMCSSALSAGATKPMTWASNPSMNTTAAH